MPNAHSFEIRERAVRAYESGEGSYETVAARFGLGRRTLQEWVALHRETGSVRPKPKRGGNPSPVDMEALEQALRDRPDAIVEELKRMHNACVSKSARVHRSSILRALHRRGYVFKKNVRGPQNKIDPMSKKSADDS
jgi:transposase